MFWFFGRKAGGILTPRLGIEPTPPALEGEVLTTGLPGKSLELLYYFLNQISIIKKYWNFMPNSCETIPVSWIIIFLHFEHIW